MSRAAKLSIVAGTLAIALGLLTACGDGALKRQFTMAGVYSICKPDGYPVVCFADADGKDGGLYCMPLSAVGGKCL
jgi:hypothetical protein